MCRSSTQWQPTLQERTGFIQLVQHGWKNLPSQEQNFLRLVWLIALLASFTDPFVLYLAAFILTVLLPPTLFPTIVVFLSGIRQAIGKNVFPGSRLFFIIGIASSITFLTLANRAYTQT